MTAPSLTRQERAAALVKVAAAIDPDGMNRAERRAAAKALARPGATEKLLRSLADEDD